MSCSPGLYASTSGATTCAACAAGTAQADLGASACLACDASSEYSSEGDTTCLPCGATPARLSDPVRAQECVPAEEPGEGEIWVSTRGADKRDECLPTLNSSRSAPAFVRVNPGSRCEHELRVLGRPDLSGRYILADAAPAWAPPHRLVVHRFNETFYPAVCKEGQAFAVAHTGSGPFGAFRIMIVTDTQQGGLLFEAPCEGVWGVCSVPFFCPVVDVDVTVCVQDAAGDVLVEASTRVGVSHPRPCPPVPSSSWTLHARVHEDAGGRALLPGEALPFSLHVLNGPPDILAFRIRFRLHESVELLSVNHTVKMRVEQADPSVVVLFGDVSAMEAPLLGSLGLIRLRVRETDITALVDAVRFEAAEFLVGRNLWLMTPILGEGFSCDPTGALRVLLDHRRPVAY